MSYKSKTTGLQYKCTYRLSPLVAYAAVRFKSVELLMVIHCWLLLSLWESVIVLYFVVRYFIFTIILQSSWWGRESWLLCFYFCIPSALWLLCGSSLRCHVFVYSCDCGISWSYSLFLRWESNYMLKVVEYDAYWISFNSIDTMKAIKM